MQPDHGSMWRYPTPSASASFRIVRGCARCLPASRRLIVSKAILVIRDKSRCDSARSRLSSLNFVPSTSVNLSSILAFYYLFLDKSRPMR